MFGTRAKLATAVAVVGAVGVTGAAIAGNGGRNFNAELSGFEEVPVVMTTGNGTFKAEVNRAGTEIRYTLTYRDLEGGGGTPAAAHIHIGQKDVNGGIAAFLCRNPPTATTPACPPAPASVSDVITAAEVEAIPTQGLAAGEMAELLRAMRAGVTYANVHTPPQFGGGEIRGQIGRGGGGDGDGRGGDDDSDSD